MDSDMINEESKKMVENGQRSESCTIMDGQVQYKYNTKADYI